MIVTGVTDSPIEEQAVNINSPAKYLNSALGRFFMNEPKYYSTQIKGQNSWQGHVLVR
jgi:hypothetical protein